MRTILCRNATSNISNYYCWTRSNHQQVFRGVEGKLVLLGFLFHVLLLLGFLDVASVHIFRYTCAKNYVAFTEENIVSSGLSDDLLEIGLVTPYTINFPIILTSKEKKKNTSQIACTL